jgi:hypothetical protein
MKKSNDEDILLTHQQASRLVNLFATSFDACLDTGHSREFSQPVHWHPTLTDIHQQVVHQITPVLIQAEHVPGDSSPTLTLSLLGIPSHTQLQQYVPVERHLPSTDVMPTVKPAV